MNFNRFFLNIHRSTKFNQQIAFQLFFELHWTIWWSSFRSKLIVELKNLNFKILWTCASSLWTCESFDEISFNWQCNREFTPWNVFVLGFFKYVVLSCLVFWLNEANECKLSMCTLPICRPILPLERFLTSRHFMVHRVHRWNKWR